MNNTLAANLARRVLAVENCRVNAREAQDQRGRQYWAEKKVEHENTIEELLENYMPAGSGFDSCWHLDLDKSAANKLILYSDFHRMNEQGYYDGWFTIKVTVKPSLPFGIDAAVAFCEGSRQRDREMYRDYFEDLIIDALSQELSYV